ncbi:hypothetical protein [Niallia endozanthoxylica]|nr:hypothetical protein [Niallia endozanthoxylica]
MTESEPKGCELEELLIKQNFMFVNEDGQWKLFNVCFHNQSNDNQ